MTAQLCHEERSAFVPFGGLSNLDGDGASLAFTARECCRCRESCSACATRSSAAPGEKVPSSECARTDEGSEGGFLLTPGWSPQRPFPFFGAKRKITPPPPPFVKPPSPPSLPQHRRQFTRLQCFQAAQQKATKAPSGRKIPSHTLPTRRLPSPSVLVPMV